MFGVPVRETLPQAPIWSVLLALGAGWYGGHEHAVYAARAAAAESALSIVRDVEDDSFSKGAASAFVGAAGACEDEKRAGIEKLRELLRPRIEESLRKESAHAYARGRVDALREAARTHASAAAAYELALDGCRQR